jgi:hypothetical protein
VVQASTPARKDRFECNDNPGVIGMMTQPMGEHMKETSGPIGKENCVELIVPPQLGNMLGGIMGANPMQLAFGGKAKSAVNDNRQRTWYLQCDFLSDANDWAAALTNNINCIEAPSGPGGGDMFGQVDNMLTMAKTMQNDLALANDSSTSLEWYRKSLHSKLPLEELFAGLCIFYDSLDQARVPHM